MIIIIKIYLTNYFYKHSLFIPKSYKFVNYTLRCDLSVIVTELNTLLPQLGNFITQFNQIVNESGISVITDSAGNMSIDVPQNMPDSVANNITTRIGIIDRLITTRGQQINSLLQEGISIEKQLKIQNPNYTSELQQSIDKFKELNNSYRH